MKIKLLEKFLEKTALTTAKLIEFLFKVISIEIWKFSNTYATVFTWFKVNR